VAGDYARYSYDGELERLWIGGERGFMWRLNPDGSFDFRLNPRDTTRTRSGLYELDWGEGGCVNIRIWDPQLPEGGDQTGSVCGDTLTFVVLDRGERHEQANVRQR
jgi:hypothetical protein